MYKVAKSAQPSFAGLKIDTFFLKNYKKIKIETQVQSCPLVIFQVSIPIIFFGNVECCRKRLTQFRENLKNRYFLRSFKKGKSKIRPKRALGTYLESMCHEFFFRKCIPVVFQKTPNPVSFSIIPVTYRRRDIG